MRPSVRRLAILLFALVWFGCAWFGSWEWNANNSTRLFAAISLAEDGDATIDEFAGLTIDKARFDGHAYSDKPPGMTLLAAPIVWAADRATGVRAASLPKRFENPTLGAYLKLRLRLVVALVIAPLCALAAIGLFRLVGRATADPGAGLVAALAFGVASPVWGWSTTLLGHAPVAALYMIALWAIEAATERRRAATAMIAGLALSWAVLIEYQAVLGAAVLGIWAIWRTRHLTPADRLRLAAAVAAGGFPALAALLGYNLLAFGTPFRIAYSGVSGFDGMKEGLFGLTWPKPHVLLEILFGPRRGLLWVAPPLMLSLFGVARMVRDPADRAWGVLAAGGAATVLLLNAAYVYWDGGVSTGPRHTIPAIGFLAIALGFRWAAMPRERPVIAVLLALGYVINAIIAATDIFSPPHVPYPLWQWIIVNQFLPGGLRTFPSDWFNISPWLGFAAYFIVAIPLILLLIKLTPACRSTGQNV